MERADWSLCYGEALEEKEDYFCPNDVSSIQDIPNKIVILLRPKAFASTYTRRLYSVLVAAPDII